MRFSSMITLGYAVALGWLLLPASSARADAIYWSTGFGQTIERANLDGTGRQTVTGTGNLSAHVALDRDAGQIYWTGVQGRGIYRVNTDGTGLEHLITPAGDPQGIALDAAAGKMYWAENLPVPRIQRANLDGSGQETVIEIGSLGPAGLTLDPVHDHLYWSDPYGGGIYRVDTDGSNRTQIVDLGMGQTGLALDLAGGMVYWCDNDDDVIRRANLDGSGIETLVTGLGNPLGIALDLQRGEMYWADHGLFKIQRANLDGSDVEDFLDFADHIPLYLALDVSVPEPATGLMLGLLGVMACRRRQRWTK